MCADSFKLFFAEEILYLLTLVAVKTSILLLCRSSFAGWAFHKFANVVNVTSAFVVAWGLALILVSICTCKPIHADWDITIAPTCINSDLFYFSTALANICMDVFILSLPARKVLQMQMPLKEKFLVFRSVSTRRIVSILFLNEVILILTKLSVCISSGVRLYMLFLMNEADPSCAYQIYSNLSRVSAAEVL